MPKKRLYLIIAITAIITIGFFLAAYIISRQGDGESASEPKNSFANFFPFGKGTGNEDKKSGNGASQTGGNGASDTPDSIPLVAVKDLSALRQISRTPTAGLASSLLSGKTAVRFVERTTGNIFETAMEDMRRDRISNTLIPKIHEAFFGNDGKHLVYRYLKEGGSSIVTFVRNVPNPNRSKVEAANATTTDPTTGSFLPENVMSVIVSRDTKNMFYLEKTPNFSARQGTGSIFNFQKNTSTRVFQSPFSEWLPVSFDGKTAVLQTKASQNVPGFLYSMSASNGELQKIIGGINGLTALPSPNLQKILYSESTRGGIILRLYDRKEKTTANIQSATLPEKCVWHKDSTIIYCAVPSYLPTAEYPDAWYQGSVAFDDELWKINAKTGEASVILFPSEFGRSMLDMTNLTLSSDADFLFFINKTDSTLWGYDLQHKP